MAPDAALDEDVQTLVSAPEQDAAETLPGHGIAFIVLSAPVDGNVAAVLDATTGLEGASADDRDTRAWRVTPTSSAERSRPRPPGGGWRCWRCRASRSWWSRCSARPPRPGRSGHDRRDRPDPAHRPPLGRRPRISPTAVLAVLLPALTVGALALVRPAEVTVPSRPAEQVAPTRVDLVCPEGPGGLAARPHRRQRDRGRCCRQLPRRDRPVPDRRSSRTRSQRSTSRDPAWVRGNGPVAAELIGGAVRRAGARLHAVRPAATGVLVHRRRRGRRARLHPRADQPRPGTGGRRRHRLGRDRPDRRPRPAGHLAAGRRDRADRPRLGACRGAASCCSTSSSRAVGWAPAWSTRSPPWAPGPRRPRGCRPRRSRRPSRCCSGSPRGEDADDTLVIGNPGTSEVRAELRVVTQDAAFVPEGLEEVRIDPESTETDHPDRDPAQTRSRTARWGCS